MPKQTTIVNSFNLGEISPRAYGRYDGDKPVWKMSAKKIENMLTAKQGGAFMFPGSTYVANTKNNNAKIRIESIAYSISQEYVLELGNLYMRFYSNVNGVPGQVVLSNVAGIDSFTKLLSHFNGSNFQTSYTAETNQIFSFFGNANISTGQKIFGNSSLSLDGTNSYVTLPDDENWNLGTGDFTIDCWIYFNSLTGNQTIFSQGQTNDATNYMNFYWDGTNNKWKFYQLSPGFALAWSSTVQVNAWHHIEFVRSGNNFAVYQDGILLSVSSSASALANFTGALALGTIYANNADQGSRLNGYIDEFRWSKGIARNNPIPDANTKLLLSMDQDYTDFSPSPHTVTAHGNAVVDATAKFFGPGGGDFPGFFTDTNSKLVAHFDGNNGDTAYTAETGQVFTFHGAAALTTDINQKVFGTAGLSLTGANSYVSVPDSANWDFSGGVWSVDCRVKVIDLNVARTVWGQPTDGANFIQLFIATNGSVYLQIYSGNVEVLALTSSAGLILPNIFYHIYVVENGNNYYIFINGVQVATTSSAIRPANYTQTFNIGTVNSGVFFNGYIDEFRIENGTAPWVSAFIVPQTPYTTTANYLTVPDSADWDFSGGVWTVDSWVKPLAFQNSLAIWSQITDVNNYMECFLQSDGTIGFVIQAGGVQAVYLQSSPAALTVNTYQHVAVVENGNNYYIFVNGVQVATVSSANRPANYTGTFQISSWNAGSVFAGYQDEFRVSNGTARWTANFSVQTTGYLDFVPATQEYSAIFNWITATQYHLGDFVVFGGNVYVCLIAHTSGTFATDLAAGDWLLQNAYEIATPFNLADVFSLQFAGKADVTYIVGTGYQQQKLKRLGATSFTIGAVQTIRGPFLPQNVTTTTITPSSATGTTTLTASAPIFQAGHVGALFRVNSTASIGACVLITGFTSATVVTGVVQNEPDGTAGNIGGTSAYLNWAEGAFSNVQGWPNSVTFHEQRLVYGLKDFFYASKTGQYDNFDADVFGHSTGYTGSTSQTDASAYSYQLATDQAATIRWLSSNTSLEIGTTGGTFSAVGGTAGITPTAISVTPDSDYNVFPGQPEKMSSYLYYLDGNSFTVRQLVFDLALNKQKSEDMTQLADHILRDGLGGVQMAHQKSPNDRLWIPRVDGQLAIFTRDATQNIAAWCRKVPAPTIAGTGFIESVAILTQDGGDDQIWVSVQRNINGVTQRFIEVFNAEIPQYYWQYNNLDASLTYDNPIAITGITNANPGVITAPGHGRSNGDQVKIDIVVGLTALNTKSFLVANVTANTFTLTDLSSNPIDTTLMGTYLSGGQVRLMQSVFTGLSYLNGETVYVQSDGLGTLTPYTVSAGSITLGAKAAVVHVGLKYVGKLQLLPNIPETKMAKMTLATLRLYQSIGGKLCMVDQFDTPIGVGLLPLPYLTTTPNMISSEDVEITPDSTFDKWNSVLIEQDSPNPLYVEAANLVGEAFER